MREKVSGQAPQLNKKENPISRRDFFKTTAAAVLAAEAALGSKESEARVSREIKTWADVAIFESKYQKVDYTKEPKEITPEIESLLLDISQFQKELTKIIGLSQQKIDANIVKEIEEEKTDKGERIEALKKDFWDKLKKYFPELHSYSPENYCRVLVNDIPRYLAPYRIFAKPMFCPSADLANDYFSSAEAILALFKISDVTSEEVQQWDKKLQRDTVYIQGHLKIKNQAINVANLKSVSIKITDRFDAGSQTDAGGSFENALPIEAGQYKGFLDFNYEASDGEDFYKISVARGQKLTVKVTPPKDLCLDLKIYDKNRSELVDETSDNEGAIVTGSIQALTTDIFYIAVAPEYSSELDQAGQYSLDISGGAPDTQKSGIANSDESLPDNPLSQISASVSSGILGIIGKSIKFILLIAATVLIIIVVTVILLLGKSNKNRVAEKEVPSKEKTPVKTEFIYCSKCGLKNPAGAKFCSKCGEKLI